MNKLGILEGILFVVGDEGITLDKICNILEISTEEAKELLKNLQSSYESDERGIRVSFLGNSFKLTTKKEHKDYYQKLIESDSGETLSNSALEVLALVAYNQPITRAEIDEARGLASNYVLRKLVAKDLIKVSGKSDLPGRPNLYKTTSDFLDYFGLSSLQDLPAVEAKETSSEEKELFTSIYKENSQNQN
jgi:segregation and condensation protein B